MGDWRGETLGKARAIIKSVVKLTFHKGAALDDPSGMLNSSLEGKVRRAIDIEEHDEIDEEALKGLVIEAAATGLRSR